MINKKKKKKKKKLMGDNGALARWLDKYCPKGCGCKLRTDGSKVWCSYINCTYYTSLKRKG